MPGRSTSTSSQKPLRERVLAVLETLRPSVQSDGGDIELIDVNAEGIVKVRFHGACVGCPSSEMTLTMGIERTLRHEIPEVTSVISV